MNWHEKAKFYMNQNILPEQSGVEGKGILCTCEELFLQPAVKIPNTVTTTLQDMEGHSYI